METVISGSLSKHFAQMMLLTKFLRERGIDVLSPLSPCSAGDNDTNVILLESEPVADPRTLQDGVFAKIRCSSFLLLANIDGYVGRAAAMEIGFATGLRLQVLCIEPVADPNLAGYCRLAEEVFPGIADALVLREQRREDCL